MARLHIYGAGGYGREVVAPALELRNVQLSLPQPLFTEVGFVDDTVDEEEILGCRVYRPDEIAAGDYFVIAVGHGGKRKELYEACIERSALPLSLLAQSCRIGWGVEIGPGAIFSDFTMVTASASIGIQFHCNIYSYVAHDCVIGDYVTFAPKVCCNGNVHVRDFAYVGTGAVIKQGTPEAPVVIGEGAIVGMGAVVTKSVPDGVTVVGNPARIRGEA